MSCAPGESRRARRRQRDAEPARPAQRVRRSLIAELTDALQRARRRTGCARRRAGERGKSFSAGRRSQLDAAHGGLLATRPTSPMPAALASMLHTLDRLPKPTSRVVQGPAYGGGIGLVAGCDT